MSPRTFLVHFLMLVGITVGSNGRESRIVNIDQGPVRGYMNPGEGFYSFYSIPFATPTVRYQVAQPPPTWTEPFEAIDRRIVCPQVEVVYVDLSDKLMQEDCLIINIFMPDTNQTNLPVLVDVHGGAFHSGLGNAHRLTSFAATRNIVVVTFNYRIGLLGFLCLGTEKIPGNVGMKDQITALRWVQRNIVNFGGNPNDVTISGCSAGGAAVDHLLISKAARGLFHKAIPDSGSNLGPFSVQLNPLENAKERARALNFTDVDNIEALEELFMTVPFEQIISIPSQEHLDGLVDYAPCVERDVGQEMFFDDAPYNILKNGDFERYPTLYGMTDLEGLMLFTFYAQWSVMMNENFADFLPGDLKFDSDEEKAKVADEIKQFYFGNESISVDYVLSHIIDYHSDIRFTYPMLRTIKLLEEAGNSSVFLYEYSFHNNNTPSNTSLEGAGHCTQTRAVRDEVETGLTQEYLRMKILLRDVWEYFIKTGNPVVNGNPVPSWPAVGPNRSPHLSVGSEIQLRGPLLEERARLWDSVYKKYYKVPLKPVWPSQSDAASTPYSTSFWIMSTTLTLIYNRL